ncbi:hypothetical protein K438DRAFT_1971740 [Mycena galopus ATCC 62051]|nr:hypothetical protein K438DRAFT_1971740 [Mycena galopus ATCC 62051]
MMFTSILDVYSGGLILDLRLTFLPFGWEQPDFVMSLSTLVLNLDGDDAPPMDILYNVLQGARALRRLALGILGFKGGDSLLAGCHRLNSAQPLGNFSVGDLMLCIDTHNLRELDLSVGDQMDIDIVTRCGALWRTVTNLTVCGPILQHDETCAGDPDVLANSRLINDDVARLYTVLPEIAVLDITSASVTFIVAMDDHSIPWSGLCRVFVAALSYEWLLKLVDSDMFAVKPLRDLWTVTTSQTHKLSADQRLEMSRRVGRFVEELPAASRRENRVSVSLDLLTDRALPQFAPDVTHSVKESSMHTAIACIAAWPARTCCVQTDANTEVEGRRDEVDRACADSPCYAGCFCLVFDFTRTECRIDCLDLEELWLFVDVDATEHQ